MAERSQRSQHLGAHASVLGGHTSNGEVPRLALRKLEAARALGVSDETFDKFVKPHLPCVRWGSVRLYPVAALAAFLEQQASSPLEDVA